MCYNALNIFVPNSFLGCCGRDQFLLTRCDGVRSSRVDGLCGKGNSFCDVYSGMVTWYEVRSKRYSITQKNQNETN